MIKARLKYIQLQFKFPAGTSRGVLHQKPAYFLILEENGFTGIGECSIIPALSIDPMENYENKLKEVCNQLNQGLDVTYIDLYEYPSIAFGLETALLDLKVKGSKKLYPSDFTEGKTGININGLIWMGNKEFMIEQIHEKIPLGFRCIKLKIGALDFETELEIIAYIRKHFSSDNIEIRLDANGGFTINNALKNIERLAKLQIHSIEQPIKQGQIEEMAEICRKSSIPVVLDEELISVKSKDKAALLKKIKPSYLVLKPSLLGGFKQSEEWIALAEKQNIKWWITSALESNIGLNAIAQWTYSLNSDLPQGLGTGQLYQNNIPSPLEIKNAKLFYRNTNLWDCTSILK